MDEQAFLAEKFEARRAHLKAVAYRMLGSAAEAEDAVQEAWLRVSRAGAHDIENLGGWLTTVVARICLDLLRAHRSRPEESLDGEEPTPAAGARAGSDPEEDAVVTDSVGLALLVVLDTLNPAERVAFVLHDLFDLPFEDIAPIVGKSVEATRQLASRGRRRVRGATARSELDRARQTEVVEAFLAASKRGDLAALVSVLDPDVVFLGDAAAVKLGGPAVARGAQNVAKLFVGRARAAGAGVVAGSPAIIVAPRGRLLLILGVVFRGDKIAGIEAIADGEELRRLGVAGGS